MNVLLGRERFDFESWSDPAPALKGWLAFSREAAGALGLRAMNRVSIAMVRRRMERLRGSQALVERIRAARSVLFVCQGNINRSAVAERALTRSLGTSSKSLRVASAGFDPRSRRRSTAVSRSAAGDLHIDLDSHASTPLTREMLAEFDLVVVMELSHVVRVLDIDQEAVRKCLVLSLLDPAGGSLDIPDPDGKPRSTFSAIYARVVRCVDALHDLISTPAAATTVVEGRR